MAYTYPVKYIHNLMRGAPQISGTAGTRVAALDALLIDGWGTTTALSVSVASGVGTATFNAGTTFEAGAIVAISGTSTTLDGEARVLTSAAASITFETDAADGTYSGTIIFKYAPVGGWEIVYTDTNKRVYRSTDIDTYGHLWRIDDTGTTNMRIVGYESMTDIDTGSMPFPTDAQVSGGGYLHVSRAANTTAVRYWMRATSKVVEFAFAPGSASVSTYLSAPCRGFGYGTALSPAGDAHCAFVNTSSSSSYANAHLGALDYTGSSSFGGTFMARVSSGAGSSVLTYTYPYCGSSTSFSSSDATLGAFPSTVDGHGKPSRRYSSVSTSDKTPRANIPGLYHLPQSGVLAAGVAPGDVIDGGGDLAGHRLLALGCGTVAVAPTGIYLLDLSED